MSIILKNFSIRKNYHGVLSLGKKTLVISTIFFLITIIFFDLTDVDVFLQDKLYWFEQKRWLFDDNATKKFYYYTLIKVPIYFIGLFALYKVILGWRKKINYGEMRKYLIIFLTLAILPTTIALVLKKAINVQCPSDIPRYGGNTPYVKLFEKYPPNPKSLDGKWPNGHCWPAGHCSGGFALLSLWMLAKNRRQQIYAVLFSLAFAIPMAWYQTVRGNHFLSHTLSTLFMALMLISALNLILKKEDNHEPKNN